MQLAGLLTRHSINIITITVGCQLREGRHGHPHQVHLLSLQWLQVSIVLHSQRWKDTRSRRFRPASVTEECFDIIRAWHDFVWVVCWPSHHHLSMSMTRRRVQEPGGGAPEMSGDCPPEVRCPPRVHPPPRRAQQEESYKIFLDTFRFFRYFNIYSKVLVWKVLVWKM